MPSYQIFVERFNRAYEKRSGGIAAPENLVKWAYCGFRMGYNKGRDDFANQHETLTLN